MRSSPLFKGRNWWQRRELAQERPRVRRAIIAARWSPYPDVAHWDGVAAWEPGDDYRGQNRWRIALPWRVLPQFGRMMLEGYWCHPGFTLAQLRASLPSCPIVEPPRAALYVPAEPVDAASEPSDRSGRFPRRRFRRTLPPRPLDWNGG